MGECITRKATPEELEAIKDLPKPKKVPYYNPGSRRQKKIGHSSAHGWSSR